MKTTPKQSDLDIYINDIVDKLRAKYGYADKNRLMKRVRFYYHLTDVIELTYTELEESMNRKEYPKEIQKLL